MNAVSPPPSPVLRIRDFAPADADALRQVYRSSIHDQARDYYTPEQLDAWAPAAHDPARWARRLADLQPFVAVRCNGDGDGDGDGDEHPIGYADLQADGYIDHFFVAGGHGRQGVGRALMAHLLGLARARGLPRLYANVSLAAEGFFARHGFVVEERRVVSVNGVALRNARMALVPLPGPAGPAPGADRSTGPIP